MVPPSPIAIRNEIDPTLTNTLSRATFTLAEGPGKLPRTPFFATPNCSSHGASRELNLQPVDDWMSSAKEENNDRIVSHNNSAPENRIAMTKPNEGHVVNDESSGATRSKRKEFGADDFAELNDLGDGGPKVVLRESEKEFFRELVLALRTIRYGSIVLDRPRRTARRN